LITNFAFYFDPFSEAINLDRFSAEMDGGIANPAHQCVLAPTTLGIDVTTGPILITVGHPQLAHLLRPGSVKGEQQLFGDDLSRDRDPEGATSCRSGAAASARSSRSSATSARRRPSSCASSERPSSRRTSAT
jgi:hypothetical protein